MLLYNKTRQRATSLVCVVESRDGRSVEVSVMSYYTQQREQCTTTYTLYSLLLYTVPYSTYSVVLTTVCESQQAKPTRREVPAANSNVWLFARSAVEQDLIKRKK